MRALSPYHALKMA